jgi:hypothetical protein
MGLFANPLSYAGYPPGVTGTPTTQNSTVRAATAAEAAAGTLTNAYISPATADSATALDFASPPAGGFGSTTPRPVHATTLDSTLNTLLATDAAATAVSIANVAPSGARTGIYHGGNSAQNDTITWLGGAMTAGTQSFSVLGGASSGGTQTVNFFAGNTTGNTKTYNVLTGTGAGTFNLGTAAATAHTLNIGNASALIGFYGATAVTKPILTADIKDSLVGLGLITDGGATPLNLDSGALTAGSVAVAAPSVSGASPVVNNARSGQASFTDVIANGAYGTLTITNSTVSASSVIVASASCTTANSAVQIVEITPGSGSVALRIFNAGSASTAANINVNYWVMN